MTGTETKAARKEQAPRHMIDPLVGQEPVYKSAETSFDQTQRGTNRGDLERISSTTPESSVAVEINPGPAANDLQSTSSFGQQEDFSPVYCVCRCLLTT